VTIAEAAATEQVDRSTIIRFRTVAKDGASSALAASKPGVGARQRDYELEGGRAISIANSETCQARRSHRSRHFPVPRCLPLPVVECGPSRQQRSISKNREA